ncbi:MAG: hypothetical protein M9894_05410 [Planctomycetes bacterium]|nr:hypothetical protein [Planctomycetota bacterium]
MTAAPFDAAGVIAPGRVALWRAVVCVPSLALALGAWGRWWCGAVDPMFVALGASLGLVAAALSFPEAIARRGALPRGLAWAMALALPGVLWAAAQAAYTERALALGPAATIDDVHEGLWLALHDPLTGPIVVLWAGALAGSVLARTHRRAWAATMAALALTGGPLLAREGAFGSHLLAVRPAVSAPQLALPSGIRRFELEEVPVGGSAGGEALVVALLLACLVPACAALGDALRRRLGRAAADGEVESPRRGLAAPLALAAGAVLLLGWSGRRAPGAGDVAWLIARLDRYGTAGLRVLVRTDPDDPRAVGALAAALRDRTNSPGTRRRAAELLHRIGAAGSEAVAALAAAATARDFEVSGAARRALVALGPRARAAGPSLLHAELLTSQSDRRQQELRDLQGAIGYEPTTAELLVEIERGSYEAVRRLAEHPSVDPAAVPALAPFLDAHSFRPAAVLALAKAGARGTALLEERFRRPDVGRSWLPEALGVLPRTPAALEVLLVAAEHEDMRVWVFAHRLLTERVDGDPWPGSAELLLDRLDRDASGRLSSIVASYGARASPGLSERLRDPARRMRALFIVLDAGITVHATAPALIEVLRARPEGPEGWVLIRALQAVACPQNAPAFLDAVDDPDPAVRGPVLLALGLGAADDDARARAWQALDETDADLRGWAALGLASAAVQGRWRPSPDQAQRLSRELAQAPWADEESELAHAAERILQGEVRDELERLGRAPRPR